MMGGREQNVVEHGQASQCARYLKGPDEPTACDPMGWRMVDASALELHGSSFGREKPGDDVEQRRLAGAVRADQRGDRSLLDIERRAVDRAEPAEGTYDLPHCEHRRAHSSTISLLLPKMPC